MKPYVITIYRDRAQEYRWRMKRRRGGKTIMDSGEGYKRRSGCRRAVWNLPFNFAHIEVIEK